MKNARIKSRFILFASSLLQAFLAAVLSSCFVASERREPIEKPVSRRMNTTNAHGPLAHEQVPMLLRSIPQ